MTLPIIAAFSLGVHLLVLLALGLLGGGSSHIRAYRLFLGSITLWLILLLAVALDVATDVARPMAGIAAHALPILLLLGRALPVEPIDRRAALAVLVVAVALAPFTVDASPWHNRLLETLYFVGAWTAVALRVARAFRRWVGDDRRLRRQLVAATLILGPTAIGLLIAAGAIVAIALLSAGIQVVVLYATVRLSLYQIRMGASRTSALAAEAAEHDRRAVAGEIAAMVAHEVRNPLTGVRSLAQRLADDRMAEERRQRYAALIVREVDRVEAIVSALLGASGRRSGEPLAAVTPVRELFDDVALLVSGRYRRAEVTLETIESPLLLAAPREPVAQILLNLLLNAVTQAPRDSRVRLFAADAGGGWARLAVADRGPGVPPEERAVIFEPFHSGTGGSGLGLSVVRRLCEERGWTVGVDETPGGGATFWVRLPVARAAAPIADDGAALQRSHVEVP